MKARCVTVTLASMGMADGTSIDGLSITFQSVEDGLNPVQFVLPYNMEEGSAVQVGAFYTLVVQPDGSVAPQGG